MLFLDHDDIAFIYQLISEGGILVINEWQVILMNVNEARVPCFFVFFSSPRFSRLPPMLSRLSAVSRG